jgi:hypothetical protein
MSATSSAVADKFSRPVAMRTLALVALVTIAFIALCIAGIVLRYSPLPLPGDDWEVYVAFNLDVLEGKSSAWWAVEASHRLILPRLLFWLDFRFFGAHFIFLLITNIVMRIAIVAILIAYTQEQIKGAAFYVLSLLWCVLAFSWMQGPSFYHGTAGSVVFSAILFPLLSFYCLHRAKESSRWFTSALVSGLLSGGSMVNGIFVLPIMTVMGALIGLSARRSLILALVSAAAFALYFWHFEFPDEAHPDPLSVATFIPVYLGSPFYYVVYYWLAGLQHLGAFLFEHGSFVVTNNYLDYPESRMIGIAVAAVTGGVLIISATMIAWAWWRSERRDTCQAALLAFIGFIFITAALTAVGRASLGLDVALSERYTAGLMIAWQALAILILAKFDTEKIARSVSLLAVLLPVALLPVQLKAVLKPDIQDQLAREKSRQALVTGKSDAPFVVHQVERLREMGIEIGK